MIVVDTSALMAILFNEPEAEACLAVLETDETVLISAGTLAEALIVAAAHNVADELTRLIDALGMEVVPVTAASARRVADAYQNWGKRRHPAGLNFGDCFAYEVAKGHQCALLYVGADFAQTDIERAASAGAP